MKIVALAAFAAAIAVPTSLKANTGDPAIVVAAPTVAQWSSKVDASLKRNMQSLIDAPLGTSRSPSGMVAVQFISGQDGRPKAIKLSYKSGNAEMSSFAARAVGRLRNMHPLAAGIAENQIYEAIISVASDTDQFNDQMAQYRQAQAGAHRPDVLALNARSSLSAPRS